LVDLPDDKNSIGVKWVFKTKLNERGEFDKHKARLVSKGFSQQPRIDYGETFAPVERIDNVRFLLAIETQKKVTNLPNGCKVFLFKWCFE